MMDVPNKGRDGFLIERTEKAEPEDEPNGEECGSGYGSFLRLYPAPHAALDSGGRAGV